MDIFAITIWNDLVSPLFDASCTFLIVGNNGNHFTVDVRKLSVLNKADVCKERGVSTIICGAISTLAHEILLERGIHVVPWIRGPISEVIAAYQEGNDISIEYGMPGSHQGTKRQRNGFCQKKGKRKNGGCTRRL